jgi:hypothetical protein
MLHRGGHEFTSGRALFLDAAPGFHEETGKIFIRVVPQPLQVEILAQLDTASPWLIFDADISRQLGIVDGQGAPATLGTRFGRMDGRLESVVITIVADEGDALEIQATAFVCDAWPAGYNFVGYTGVLERVRFAVDPDANDFFFGAI